jgi:spermidine synthase
MKWLSYIFPQTIETSHSRYNKSIRVIERFGKKELYVSDIQQSGFYTARLWMEGLKEVFYHSPKNTKTILVLGIGGGTLFPMLHTLFPDCRITAVDIDGEIIRLYEKYFRNKNEKPVRVCLADARKFVTDEINKKHLYDLVIIDIYEANDVPAFVTQKSFFSSIRKILSPQGLVVFNYFSWRNQAQKSQLLLDKLSLIYQSVIKKNILRNIFFYCW